MLSGLTRRRLYPPASLAGIPDDTLAQIVDEAVLVSALTCDQAIVGPPDHWAAVLTHFALDMGFATFLLIAPPDPDTLRTFIEDVAPQVRERVASARDEPRSG